MPVPSKAEKAGQDVGQAIKSLGQSFGRATQLDATRFDALLWAGLGAATAFKTWPASGVVAVGYLGCKALNVGSVLAPVEAFADGVRRGKS